MLRGYDAGDLRLRNDTRRSLEAEFEQRRATVE